MEAENVTIPGGSYSKAANVRNADLLSGDDTFYYYDNNDKTYYPVTTSKILVDKDTYWNGFKGTTTYHILESAAAGQVGTSWVANGTTYRFDTGKGYLLSDYMIFERKSGSGYFNYYYQIIEKNGSSVSNGPTTEPSNRYTAKGNLMDEYSAYSFSFANNDKYALGYIPLTLEEVETFYYTYTYTDSRGQVWTIGHSDTFSASSNAVDSSLFNTEALGELYLANEISVTRLKALQSAATQFVNTIQAAANEHRKDHRIAIVGFSGSNKSSSGTLNSSSDYYYVNSELFVGANQYNAVSGGKNSTYNSSGNLASNMYGSAFQTVTTKEGYNNLMASIGALGAKGPTYPEAGMAIAQGLAAYEEHANAYAAGTRQLVVVFMTDGYPHWNTDNENDLDDASVSATTTIANTLKTTYHAKIFTLALLDKKLTTGSEADNFLKAVSSDGTYTLAHNGLDLSSFFKFVETSVDNTTALVDLTEDAYVVDRLSDYFQVPEGFGANNVKVYTAPHLGDEEFGDPQVQDFTYNNQNASGIQVWPTTSEADGKIKGITVHNFNFISPENLVTSTTISTDADDDNYNVVNSGNKLIITISGLLAKDSAAQNAFVETNNDHSGVWDTVKNSTTVYGKLKAFPMPTKYLANSTYVLDYAKEAMLESGSSIRQALALDSSEDGLFSKVDYSKVTDNSRTYNEYYRTAMNTTDADHAVHFGDVAIKNGRVYYTPKTMDWRDYDTFYVFWTTSQTDDAHPGVGDPVTGNGWTKISVIPANNVYYEDSFLTTNNASTTAGGTVGITYSGEWFVDKNSSTNPDTNTELPEHQENSNYANHGWVDSLADDTGYSDGSAHGANFGKDKNGNATATATFTFTGNGMDIYSRTNTKTGTIMVKVTPDAATKAQGVNTKYFIVDTLAASNGVNGYYQIPVVSYYGTHGTYEVTITVTGGAAYEEFGNRTMFYLDGIRIYCPLSNAQENDPIVDSAYGTAVDSLFMELRDKLLDTTSYPNGTAEGMLPGAVFLDQIQAGDLTPETPVEDATSGETEQSESSTEPEASEQTETPTEPEVTEQSETPTEPEVTEQSETPTEPEATEQSETPTEPVDTTTEVGTPTTTTVIGTYVDYGPKNEVYLAPGQSIVFKVNSRVNTLYFVGMKSPTGAPAAALVSRGDVNASVSIGHTTDMYYSIVPNADGYVEIKNTGETLLALTKLKKIYTDDAGPDVTGVVDLELEAISGEEALLFSATFSQMPVVPHEGPEADAPETDVTDPEQKPDVEITVPEQPSIEEQIAQLVSGLFNSIFNWFNS